MRSLKDLRRALRKGSGEREETSEKGEGIKESEELCELEEEEE